ncbi:MAG: hypothetical protein MZU97_14940 [Bacillus subtilis]|nr:hypothetical protein [Bacillus subtilis]
MNEALLFWEIHIDILSEYIRNRVSVDGGRVMNILDKGKIKPAKALQDALLMLRLVAKTRYAEKRKVAFENSEISCRVL